MYFFDFASFDIDITFRLHECLSTYDLLKVNNFSFLRIAMMLLRPSSCMSVPRGLSEFVSQDAPPMWVSVLW